MRNPANLMKLRNEQAILVTPGIEPSVFGKTILPAVKPTRWERHMTGKLPFSLAATLSPRAKQILEQSHHIQSQLQQLTQRQSG
jgi:hypothetical protein